MGLISSLNQFSNETIADVVPVNENFEKLRVANNENVSEINSINLSKANNNEVVHLSGVEEILGKKTFSDLITFSNGIDIGVPIIKSFWNQGSNFVIKLSNNFVIQGGFYDLTNDVTGNTDGIVEIHEEMNTKNYMVFVSSNYAIVSSSKDSGVVGARPYNEKNIQITIASENVNYPDSSKGQWLVLGFAKE